MFKSDIQQKQPQKKSFNLTRNHMLLLVLITIASFLVRLTLFDFVSRDYEIFLQKWFNKIADNGGILAVGIPIGDYMPTYIYILALLSYLNIPSLYSIKLVSFIGDVFLAIFAMKIATYYRNSQKISIISYSMVLFLPTVVLNSGAWAQCDSLYVAALLASIYYFITNEQIKGMIAFSISFVLKLQSIFLCPFILFLLICRRLKFRYVFIAPLAYLIAILPAAFAGRKWSDLFLIYFRQAGSYKKLSLGAPNFYSFVHTESETVAVLGITLFFVIMVIASIIILKKKLTLSDSALIAIAFFSVLFVPFVLPYMHERYFYAADVLSLIYVFALGRRWYCSVLINLSSLYVYARYLFGLQHLPVWLASIPVFVSLCVIIIDMIQLMSRRRRVTLESEFSKPNITKAV